jgi:transcriptional regulator GlxA family with amidase domain
MSENGSSEKIIAFVLYPGLTPLDLVGPLTALMTYGPVFRTVVVGERIEPMGSDTPLKLVPSATFDEITHPFVVIVPGGGLPTYQAMANLALRDWLCSVAEGAELVGSVCTGALILAAAGLLQGRQATTHWAHSKVLRR